MWLRDYKEWFIQNQKKFLLHDALICAFTQPGFLWISLSFGWLQEDKKKLKWDEEEEKRIVGRRRVE